MDKRKERWMKYYFELAREKIENKEISLDLKTSAKRCFLLNGVDASLFVWSINQITKKKIPKILIKYIFQSFLQFFEFEFKEGSYQGSLSSDGKITGEGKLVEKDICIYQGSFVDGVKSGNFSLFFLLFFFFFFFFFFFN